MTKEIQYLNDRSNPKMVRALLRTSAMAMWSHAA
ncbi:MAG: hypothetical protein JWQ38_320 [Flavipsychrobacter sp.]|nr:hypothetical protein [Flavipsychrobacter sp.]